jgi:class 3 adenylate cyclase
VKRLKPFDLFVLGVVVPAWCAWVALLVYVWLSVGATWLPLKVAAARHGSDYPTVSWVLPEWTGNGGLAVGDRLIRAGDISLQGVGHIEVHVRIRDAARTDLMVPLAIERGGARRDIVIDLHRPLSPLAALWGIFTALAYGVTAVVILLKAHDAPAARPLCLALLFCILPYGGFPVGRPALTYALFGASFIGSLFAAPLYLLAAQRIPAQAVEGHAARAWWPWLFCVPILTTWWSSAFGAPLSMEGVGQTIAIYWIALAVCMLAILARNFRRAGPTGRRQIKWVVYGAFVFYVARLLGSIVDLLDLTTVRTLQILSLADPVLPLCIFIAVARYNLFDIDRLFSATASYTVIAVVLLAGVFAVVPRLAGALGRTVGLDPSAGQVILSFALAAVVVPAQRRLRPQIERLFFRERYTLERGIEALLHDLASCVGPEELLKVTGERLDGLLRPESCVIYARAGQGYAPAFVRGRVVPVAFDGQSPLVNTLRSRTGPIVTDPSPGRRASALAPFDRAVLETVGAQLVLPVDRGADLVAFVCLGRKRSGDVYTATDLALLAGVGHALSSGLLRFDDARIIRDSQAMQEALRRYVPAPLVAQLAGGASTEAVERDVSALFVDIRGYSTYAEARNAEEVFVTSSRFADAVSRVVGEHGGTVVEFSGDGIMALFGAPESTARKERDAVQAGRELVAVVGSLVPAGSEGGRPLSIGVGIATGPAFVGDIEAADRRIWTAVGNTINLAARLQALTRDLDAAIVIDDATWRAASAIAADFVRRTGVSIRGLVTQKALYVLPFAHNLPGARALA